MSRGSLSMKNALAILRLGDGCIGGIIHVQVDRDRAHGQWLVRVSIPQTQLPVSKGL